MSQTSVILFAYAGVEPATHECIVRDMSNPKLWPPGHRVIYRALWGDGDLGRCRASAAKIFLASESDVLVMVDHDVSWEPGDLAVVAELAREKRGIAGPVVPKRALGQGIASRLQRGDEVPVEWIGEDHVLPADYVAGAILAAHREVVATVSQMPEVQTLAGPFPFLQRIAAADGPCGAVYLSEDFAFGERARLLGFASWLTTKPKVRHTGRLAFTMETAT